MRLWVFSLKCVATLFTLLLNVSCHVAASESPQSLVTRLAIADELKTADFRRFSRELEALELEQDVFEKTERQYFYYLKGYYYAFTGKYPESTERLHQAIEQSADPKITLKAKTTLLNVYVVAKKYHEAFILSDDIIRHLNESHDPDLYAYSTLAIAMIYSSSALYEEAQLYLYSVFNAPQYSARFQCIASQLLIESYYYLNEFHNMLELMDKNEQACLLANDSIFRNISKVFYSRYLLEQGEYSNALNFLKELYPVVIEENYMMLVSSVEALLAKALLNTKQLDEARLYGVKALENASFSDFNQAKIFSLEALYLVSKAEGDYQQALQFFEQLKDIQRGYRDQQQQQQISYHLARAQVQTKNQQIELLSKDNQLLYLQQQVLGQEAQNARLLLGLFVLLLLVLGCLAYQGLMGRHRFKFMAENDELTGISNRYHFNKLAERALQHCKKRDMTVGVILFDLDHFKQINDKFGHATGDWVLQQVVRTCRNFMRLDDVFGRLGGEEFAILLPGCHADKALMLAEICRDAIEEINTKPSSYEFRLTASFGVTSSDNSGFELKQLLADADKAMYKAKQSGRNQVHFFSGPSEPSSVAGTSSS
ncbi:GGDEF domain-containing protein [Alkalimonas sp. NCh-2]|uniref:GGDEF domain-containing protein n=1 Tax=Alkalimonas sp. NCh-2 TaxID=3144846 RepID=UPI0031F5FE76